MSTEQQFSKKNKRPSSGLLALLLVLLIGSILLLLTLQKSSEVASGDQSASATPVTATPTLSQTPSLTPTPTPFFYDDFVDNSKKWTVSRENDASGYIRLLQDNHLILKDTNRKTLVQNIPTNDKFQDFVLTTTFMFLEGDKNDSLGFYLRGDSTLDHNYRIDIFGNNTFAIIKEFLGTDETLQMMTLKERTALPLFKPAGELNTFTIIMKGPYLTLILNDSIVASIVDADYTQGQIALFVRNGTTSKGVSAAFDHIEIKAVPEIPFEQTPTNTTLPATTPSSNQKEEE